jgi:hypothetical protein
MKIIINVAYDTDTGQLFEAGEDDLARPTVLAAEESSPPDAVEDHSLSIVR